MAEPVEAIVIDYIMSLTSSPMFQNCENIGTAKNQNMKTPKK